MVQSLQDEQMSFAEMFESYNGDTGENLRPGDRVKGSIISIGMDTVFVNIGAKIDGTVVKQELLNDEGLLPYQQGDVLELYVISSDESEVRLSKALADGAPELLREAYAQKVPVEGQVKAPCKGGFHVDVMKRRAFCPISQIDLSYVEKPEDYVGATYRFLITRFEENGRNIVVSRRQLLAQEQAKAKEAFLKDLKENVVVEGRVRSLVPYGAFVELFPGIEGLVHISEISWARIESPDKILKTNEVVRVKVIGLKEGKKPGDLKVSLSIKQVSQDPWESEASRLKAGDRVKGKVTRCAAFGAFVELFPGVEGMIHLSEMSYVKRITRPEEMVKPGEAVDALVKAVDLKGRRISLSLRDLEGDPWTGIDRRFPIGVRCDGTLEKKEKFGYFITLSPGVTGLMPKSKVGEMENDFDRLKTGDPVSVVVDAINVEERKITLSPAKNMEDTKNWKAYQESSGGSMGELGEKLQRALGENSESDR